VALRVAVHADSDRDAELVEQLQKTWIQQHAVGLHMEPDLDVR
jgi:hypothetical protein